MHNGNVYFFLGGEGKVSTNIIVKKVTQRIEFTNAEGSNKMINGELVVDNFAGGGGENNSFDVVE